MCKKCNYYIFTEDNYIYGSAQGKNYAGHFGTISDKVQCMNWNGSGISEDDYMFPDVPGPYCRNPYVYSAQEYAASPWCYYETKDGIKFGNCDRLKVQGILYTLIAYKKVLSLLFMLPA